MHRVRYDRVRLSYLKNLLHYVNAKAKQATASWQYGKVKQLCNKVLQFGDLFDEFDLEIPVDEWNNHRALLLLIEDTIEWVYNFTDEHSRHVPKILQAIRQKSVEEEFNDILGNLSRATLEFKRLLDTAKEKTRLEQEDSEDGSDKDLEGDWDEEWEYDWIDSDDDEKKHLDDDNDKNDEPKFLVTKFGDSIDLDEVKERTQKLVDEIRNSLGLRESLGERPLPPLPPGLWRRKKGVPLPLKQIPAFRPPREKSVRRRMSRRNSRISISRRGSKLEEDRADSPLLRFDSRSASPMSNSASPVSMLQGTDHMNSTVKGNVNRRMSMAVTNDETTRHQPSPSPKLPTIADDNDSQETEQDASEANPVERVRAAKAIVSPSTRRLSMAIKKVSAINRMAKLAKSSTSVVAVPLMEKN